MNPRDFIQMMPMDHGDCKQLGDNTSVDSYDSQRENRGNNEPSKSDNSKYIILNHTTANDLIFEYNMGFGKLVIDDYRIKEFRIERQAYPPEPQSGPPRHLSRHVPSTQHRSQERIVLDTGTLGAESPLPKAANETLTPSPLKLKMQLTYSSGSQDRPRLDG